MTPKTPKLTRRQWMSLMAGGATVAIGMGKPPSLAGASTTPFPILADGRLMPEAPESYEGAMLSGGPPKDGIPSIDEPAFWTPNEADSYLDGGDVVFGLHENGVARAYPQRILVWHEIVNDRVDGQRLAVTYCPLTGTAQCFERGTTTFGVSGRLVNSNLIMFDRETDTWFPQVLAAGIRGPHSAAHLVERPLVWTTWDRWRSAHPQTEVLSTSTGFARNYNRDPYGQYNPRSGYYAPDTDTRFPLMNEDGRFPLKTVFIGARTRESAVAFRLESLRDAGRLTVDDGGNAFTAIYDANLDTGYIYRGATGAIAEIDGSGPWGVTWSGGTAPEYVNTFHGMWFAWAAFYPEIAVHA